MAELIDELNGNEKLREIFGDPVSRKLALVSESDFGVFEIKEVSLDDEKKIAFLKELDGVLSKYKSRYGKPKSEVK